MDYYTTAEQELEIKERYRIRYEREQDRIRGALHRAPITPPKEEDRMFLVEEDGHVYLGEVKPERRCPTGPVPGGGSYGIDFLFAREVEQFLKRNKKYAITFEMRRNYSRSAGIYPARITSMEEELLLEDVEIDLSM